MTSQQSRAAFQIERTKVSLATFWSASYERLLIINLSSTFEKLSSDSYLAGKKYLELQSMEKRARSLVQTFLCQLFLPHLHVNPINYSPFCTLVLKSDYMCDDSLRLWCAVYENWSLVFS